MNVLGQSKTVIIIFLIFAQLIHAHRYFYLLSSNESESSRNVDCSVESCYTLQSVIETPSKFMISDATIVFLPGYHNVSEEINSMILIQDVEHLTFKGHDGTNSSASVVHCENGTFGITFINVTDLQILDIHFSHCGAALNNAVGMETHKYTPYELAIENRTMLYGVHSYNVTIFGVVIDYSEGGLIVINMLDNFTISNSVFSHNVVNCIISTLIMSRAAEDWTYLVSYQRYSISNSEFMHGYSNSETAMASGLNLIFTRTHNRAWNIEINNVRVYNNTACYGNMLFQWKALEDVAALPSLLNFVSITHLLSTDGKNTCTKRSGGLSIVVRGLSLTKPSSRVSFRIERSNFSRNCLIIRQIVVHSNSQYWLDSIIVSNSTCSSGAILLACFTASRGNILSKAHLQNIKLIDNIGKQLTVYNCNTTIDGKNVFQRNGGDVSFEGSNVTIAGKMSFIENSFINAAPESGSTLLVYVFLIGNSELVFINNTGQTSGGMVVIRSFIKLYDDTLLYFKGNTGSNGGAIAMYDRSVITRYGGTVVIIENRALQYGGGIYVRDESYQSISQEVSQEISTCFFDEYYDKYSILFANNTAAQAGSAVYGGWLGLCTLNPIAEGTRDTQQQPQLQFATTDYNDLSLVSSNPTRVCMCEMGFPNCTITEHAIEGLQPGQTFDIEAVAVGQRFGTVPAIVRAVFDSDDTGKLDVLQYLQTTNQMCTKLSFTIKTPNENERMELRIDKQTSPDPFLGEMRLLFLFSTLFIHISLRPCSLGYLFDNATNMCICHYTLEHHGIECDLSTNTVHRTRHQWINATYTSNITAEYGILVHNNCPYDYCKSHSQQLDLEQPNDQCSFHRSAILCGGCQQNLSQVIGTSQCKACSNLWVLALVPTIAFAGVALVIGLIMLNLTVSIGTINGLIFYANIVRANHAAFFPPQTTNSFLSWFIAWVNLDLGIETCLYNGLDAYAMTWLQFVFPLYIWALVTIIIVSSHYFTTAAKLSGRNAVQVLATLFLLSYAKLLRITITAFSSTILNYPDDYNRRVWLYDGNVDYLKGKHIVLFIAAFLLLVFLSLPYTTILLSIQWLQLRSKYRALSWIHRLKPLLDAHTGPYKNKHRYWTGMLLLVRVGLFLVSSVNVLGDPAINLLSINITVFLLLVYLAYTGGIYNSIYLDLIEYSYYINLGVLSGATLYTRLTNGDQAKVVSTSVGTAIIIFVAIVIYHGCLQISKNNKIKELANSLKAKLSRKKEQQTRATTTSTMELESTVPTTIVDLREPLLTDD